MTLPRPTWPQVAVVAIVAVTSYALAATGHQTAIVPVVEAVIRAECPCDGGPTSAGP